MNQDQGESKGNLTGNYQVRIFRPAFDDVEGLCTRTRDKIEIRRHALKLRFWPNQNTSEESGQIVDLDWSWIKSLPQSRIGELRIHDDISGNDNLRVIFFVGEPLDIVEMPVIWVLSVFQKKRDDFTAPQIKVFRGRRLLVLERFYQHAI